MHILYAQVLCLFRNLALRKTSESPVLFVRSRVSKGCQGFSGDFGSGRQGKHIMNINISLYTYIYIYIYTYVYIYIYIHIHIGLAARQSDQGVCPLYTVGQECLELWLAAWR